jgi:hypothetical protein
MSYSEQFSLVKREGVKNIKNSGRGKAPAEPLWIEVTWRNGSPGRFRLGGRLSLPIFSQLQGMTGLSQLSPTVAQFNTKVIPKQKTKIINL